MIPFLTEGIAHSEAALVVTGSRHIKLLRDTLGADAVGVEFRKSDEWYSSPTAALDRYRSFVERRFQSGARWIRIVGEPVWNGRTEAEIVAWHRYESMVNLSFASSPVTVVCPYDSRYVPEQIVADACHTHPEILECGDARSSPTYRQPEEFLLNPSG